MGRWAGAREVVALRGARGAAGGGARLPSIPAAGVLVRAVSAWRACADAIHASCARGEGLKEGAPSECVGGDLLTMAPVAPAGCTRRDPAARRRASAVYMLAAMLVTGGGRGAGVAAGPSGSCFIMRGEGTALEVQPGGVITSINYPSNYANSVAGQVYVFQGTRVRFTDFDLES